MSWQADEWAERVQLELQSRGCPLGRRRYPRVRRRSGARRSHWLQLAGPFRTERAAFRWARKLRDQHGERRPLCVLGQPPRCWVGVSQSAEPHDERTFYENP